MSMKHAFYSMALAATLALTRVLAAEDCEENTAVQVQAKAVKADPKNALNNFNLASAYYNNKCYDSAIDAFERTLKFVKGESKEHRDMRFECLSALGGLYYSAKQDSEQAIENFKKALDLRPADKYSLNALSMAYVKAGDSENAMTYLKKTLLADPRNVEAHYRMAVLLNTKAEAVMKDGKSKDQRLDQADPKLFRELVEAFEDTGRLADPTDNKEILLMSNTRLGELYRDSGQVE